MAATRTTISERPSLIFTGISILRESSRQVCPGWCRNPGQRSERYNLNADQNDKPGAAVAQRRWPCLEKPGRKQYDEPSHHNEAAPPKFGVAVKSGAGQKCGQQNSI